MGSHETPVALLQLLLDACRDVNEGASRLADKVEAEPLHSFLQQRAKQYRQAAEEIRSMLHDDAQFAAPLLATFAAPKPAVPPLDDDDIVRNWERAEGVTLMRFRDVYDAELPPPLAAPIKRHFETALQGMEQLKGLQSKPR